MLANNLSRVQRMRNVVVLASSLAGCAGGGDGPDPQMLQPSLRGTTYHALAATYKVPSDPFGYTSISDASAATTVTTSPQGDSLNIAVNETTDGGSPVVFSGQRTLPPAGESYSSGLRYPAGNASLSHMAFGEWNQEITGGVIGGYFAFGNETAGPAIPTTGSATYAGTFAGKLWGLLGGSNVGGTLTASADFATRAVDIQGTVGPGSDLNFAGTLSYAAGTNSLSGTVFSTAASPHTGTANARFFGPNAEELGGVFRMARPICIFSCTGNEVYMGSFGARRQ